MDAFSHATMIHAEREFKLNEEIRGLREELKQKNLLLAEVARRELPGLNALVEENARLKNLANALADAIIKSRIRVSIPNKK